MGLSQLPSALTEALFRMPVPPQSERASVPRNRPLGLSRVNTTVWASGAVTLSTLAGPRPSNSLTQRQPESGRM